MFWVSASLAVDSSGPGSWPALILSTARWLLNFATSNAVCSFISSSRSTRSWSSPKCRSISMSRTELAMPSPPPLPAPIEARSFISVVSATAQPPLTSPRRWSSGTRTSLKKTSLNDGAAGHLAQRPHLDAGRLHVDDEAGEAAVLRLVGIGAADDLADVAVLRAGRPHLLTGDHPLVAVALGPGLETGEVGARARLAEQLAADDVAAVHARAGTPASRARWRGRGSSARPCRARCRRTTPGGVSYSASTLS